jgi:hypothetical protein
MTTPIRIRTNVPRTVPSTIARFLDGFPVSAAVEGETVGATVIAGSVDSTTEERDGKVCETLERLLGVIVVVMVDRLGERIELSNNKPISSSDSNWFLVTAGAVTAGKVFCAWHVTHSPTVQNTEDNQGLAISKR